MIVDSLLPANMNFAKTISNWKSQGSQTDVAQAKTSNGPVESSTQTNLMSSPERPSLMEESLTPIQENAHHFYSAPPKKTMNTTFQNF